MFESLEDAINFADKKDNDGGRPVFYLKAVDYKDGEGNVTSRDEIYVKIFNIGDPKNVMDRPKREEDERRWPDHWKAWKENTEVPENGTPLKAFPNFTPADIANLKRAHIRTVEEVVDLPDQRLREVLGSKANTTKTAAQKFLDYRQGDTAALLKRIEELEKQLGERTNDSAEHSGGDGVDGPDDAVRKQQPRRKKAKKAASKKRGATRKKSPVGGAD